MRAIVVRHYKTINNISNCIIGWGDSPPAINWEKDLYAVTRALNKNHVQFDAIYSSSLERARRTALFYASAFGVKTVQNSENLKEVNYGTLFEKQKKWVKNNIPEYKTDPDFLFPEGESFNQMQRRSVAYLLDLSEKHGSDTILVVVHAGVIRGLVCSLLGLDFASNLKQKVSHQYIGDFEIRKGRCIRYNELGKPSGFTDIKGVSLKAHRD